MGTRNRWVVMAVVSVSMLAARPVDAQQPNLDFTISGTSTIRGWTCTAKGRLEVTPGPGGGEAVPGFANGVKTAKLVVPVIGDAAGGVLGDGFHLMGQPGEAAEGHLVDGEDDEDGAGDSDTQDQPGVELDDARGFRHGVRLQRVEGAGIDEGVGGKEDAGDEQEQNPAQPNQYF